MGCDSTSGGTPADGVPRGGAAGVVKQVLLLGAVGAGKSSLLARFTGAGATARGGRVLTVQGVPVTLLVRDVAGDEDLFAVPASFAGATDGCVLVIDGTRAAALERALESIEMFDEDLGRLPTVAAVNKSDLAGQRQVTAEALARLSSLGCPVFHTSAATGDNVEEMFRALAGQMVPAPG